MPAAEDLTTAASLQESEKKEHTEKVLRMFEASEKGNSARKLRAMVGVSRCCEDGLDFRRPSSRGSSLLRAGSGASSLGASDLEDFDKLQLSRSSSLGSRGEPEDPVAPLPPVAAPIRSRPPLCGQPPRAAPSTTTALNVTASSVAKAPLHSRPSPPKQREKPGYPGDRGRP